MLLQALVACAGVTLGAVATSMGVVVRGGRISAPVTSTFAHARVSREAPSASKTSRCRSTSTPTQPETLAKLLELTERYCVVYQTLKHPPELHARARAHSPLPRPHDTWTQASSARAFCRRQPRPNRTKILQ